MASTEEPTPAAADQEEEPQIVKDLKAIDDKYLEVDRAFDKEVEALAAKFTEMQKPLLEQRAKLLAGDASAEDPKTGTPALQGFWLLALQNHPAMDGEIEDHDEPVLKYLKDVQVSNLDPQDRWKGFRIRFHFAENPYFENAVLSKEYHTEESSPYTGETDVTEVRGCTIQWKAGKDVTVEKVKAPSKGKKTKQSKSKEEPRNSFFRNFFRSLKKDSPLPDDVDPQEIAMGLGADDMDEDNMDEDTLVGLMLENDHDMGVAIRDNIVPFAVRWYTGEAAPDDDDDEDEEEEEEDDDEDDDDSEDEDEKDSTRKKGKQAKGKKAAPKAPSTEADAKQEECKQQ